MDRLAHSRISLEAVTNILLEEGIQKFVEPYEKLLAALDAKRKAAL
jgi:hypothetical protein